MFAIGLKRTIEEDDIYAVESDMQSELHTEAFAKSWELECKKENPSLLRIMLKTYLYKVLPVGFLFAACETSIKYEHPLSTTIAKTNCKLFQVTYLLSLISIWIYEK